MRRLALLSLITVLPRVAWPACAEPAGTIRAVELKAQAASDAKTVASLPANTTVDLVKREGAWVQLASGADLGWAKLFDVRLAGAATGPTRAAPTRSGRCWGSRAVIAAP